MRTEEEIRRDIARDVELATIGRVSQSGLGPGVDACEMVWKMMADYGVHSDGRTRIVYIERLCILAGLNKTASSPAHKINNPPTP